jgi:hypothetical protein
LDELGWLPPGEMVGLELLRLNKRMVGDGAEEEVVLEEEAEPSANRGREIWKTGTVCRGRARRSTAVQRTSPKAAGAESRGAAGR